MIIMREPVLSLKEKTTNICFPTFKSHASNIKYFMTDQLNIIFDDFGI